MNVKAFLDTNVLVYFYAESEADKRNAACQALNSYDCLTSVQALNEASNVWSRKHGWSGEKIKKHLNNIETICDEVVVVRRSTINCALELRDSYGYSYYDCLMLASAIEYKCDIILTEDMSDGQIINGELKIVNPFKKL